MMDSMPLPPRNPRTDKKRENRAGGNPSRQARRSQSVHILAIFLGGLVAWAHWPVLSAQARCFDDNQFVTSNRLVQNPSWSGVYRVFTEVLNPSTVKGYYLPLTMVSFMADFAMGGRADDFTVFHRTNLALHTMNTIMLALVMYALFGMTWPALFAAALFGFHPLTVEPIAWVSERKTLLAAFFSFGCILAYVASTRGSRRAWFWAALVLYCLAVLTKPTAVPLPVVLVLLDYWPLKVLNKRTLIAKAPFAGVALGMAIITFFSHKQSSGFVEGGELSYWQLPLLVCYLLSFYLTKIIRPIELSPVYLLPEPMSLSNPTILISLMVVLGIVLLLVALRKKTEAPLIGFLIFLATVFPTLGLIKYSWVTASDKYLYLPLAGLVFAITWAISAVWRTRSRMLKSAIVATVIVASSAEALASRKCLTRWKDSETLYGHILSHTPDSSYAHNNFGIALVESGRAGEAVAHFRESMRLRGDFRPAQSNLGKALSELQRFDEAIEVLHGALKLNPNDTPSLEELGFACLMTGRLDEAEAALRGALKRSPSNSDTASNYGTLLVRRGRFREAVEQFRRAVELDRANLSPCKSLAWILATHPDSTIRNGADAVKFAELADTLTQHRDPTVLDALAAACAEAGQFDRALQVGQRAIEVASTQGLQEHAAQIRERVSGYRQKQPFRDASLVTMRS
jgi:Flp pilus assembly protein TadD